MSWVKDTFFGGAEEKAAKAQTEALQVSQKFVEEGINEAKGSVNELFPKAAKSLNTGFGEALDVFGSAVPAQMQAFTGGNVAAQNTLLGGLPQVQNALLGRPVDYSSFQTFQQAPNTEFLNRDLSAFAPPEPAEPVTPQFNPNDFWQTYARNNFSRFL